MTDDQITPEQVAKQAEEQGTKLTVEEQADLAEAMNADSQAMNAFKKFQAILDVIQQIPPMIYDLLGREPSGPLAYCRGLAVQKLEECVHRIGDGVAALQHRDKVAEQAAQGAMEKGKIIQFPPRGTK